MGADVVVAVGLPGKGFGAEGAREGFEQFGEMDSQVDIEIASLHECAQAVGALEGPRVRHNCLAQVVEDSKVSAE